MNEDVSTEARLQLLRSALEECRDAIHDIGGGGEVAAWTGNDRCRGIIGRVEYALKGGQQ